MDFPKPLRLMNRIIHIATQKDSYVMDFFSGSATTAHAVFLQNAKDSGNRKFIMVQVQEACDRDSGAARAGYATMCDIGEDRIRRAGKKIKEESPLTTANLDLGFRVFQVDSSNMEDVYYRPTEVDQGQMNIFADNIIKRPHAGGPAVSGDAGSGCPFVLKDRGDCHRRKESIFRSGWLSDRLL